MRVRDRRLLGVALLAGSVALACNGQIRFDDVDASVPRPLDASLPDAAAIADRDGGGSSGEASVPAEGGTTSGPSGPCGPLKTCLLPSLVCDPTTARCVECLDPSQCSAPGRRACDPKTHRCVPCAEDTDCPANEKCQRLANRCVKSCSDSQECAAPLKCDQLIRQCVECRTYDLTADDCNAAPGGKFCDPSAGRCGQCAIDAQCPQATPLCDRTTGACAQCLTGADCPQGAPICDPAAHVCLALP